MNKKVYFEIDKNDYHNEDFKYCFAVNKIWLKTNEDNETFANIKYYTKNKKHNLISNEEGSNYVTFTIPMDIETFNKVKCDILNESIVSTIKLLLDICEDEDYKLYLIEDMPTILYERKHLFDEISKHFPTSTESQKFIKLITNHKKSHIEGFNLNQEQGLVKKQDY